MKEHLTRTFVMHYSRIPSVLEMSRDPDTLSNRVVHMSVQLFSNESLALKMVTRTTTSICSCRRRVVPAIVAIPR